jgi:hypothetical protein
MSPALLRSCLVAAALGGTVLAQNPAPAPIRPVPPPGVTIPDGDRSELQTGVTALGKEIVVLKARLKDKPELLELLPDVMIFHKAVDWALKYNEIFDVKQIGVAKKLLETGNQRALELKDGKASWTTATGLVPRGYISKIDGSVQPYGMVIPEDWKADDKTARRLDFWCHGRGEKLSELDFVNQRLTSKGEFQPAGAFTLHLYGRYCCANKFAGEVDLFEALENAKKHYKIDTNKLVVRGFSMGGAAVWQFGTHFSGMWAAVQPGAGFAESREFLKLGTTPDKPLPSPWEQTLWRWYDASEYVANLANTTTVAYSGEIDGQKQACDIMIRFARQEAGNANPPRAELNKVAPGDGSPSAAEARVTGTAPDLAFFHIIGPQTAHKIKAEAKPEIEKLLEGALAKGTDPAAEQIRFTTFSLIYPEMKWVRIEGMEKQWERANINARLVKDAMPRTIEIKTENVSKFTITLPDSFRKFLTSVVIDGQQQTSKGETRTFVRAEKGGRWAWVRSPEEAIGKRPGLCGPIDHAFMDKFVFVRPTGQPLNEKVGAWATSELDHAIGFWRKVFRGDAPVKDDTAVSDDDIKNSNLILWGDPSSNAILKKIADKLPVKWDAKSVVFAGQTYDAASTAPVLIFPNPLNPSKYVVLNSSVTFREQALLNNADQIPKLPDWAIIDVNTPPNGKWPGEVKAAGFFDEQWKVPAK